MARMVLGLSISQEARTRANLERIAASAGSTCYGVRGDLHALICTDKALSEKSRLSFESLDHWQGDDGDSAAKTWAWVEFDAAARSDVMAAVKKIPLLQAEVGESQCALLSASAHFGAESEAVSALKAVSGVKRILLLPVFCEMPKEGLKEPVSDENFAYRLWNYDGAPGALIPLLQSAQAHFGYVPKKAIQAIAAATGVGEAEIYGVITFYSQFRLQPMGRHVIRACAGTACHVSGAKSIADTLRDELGIDVGETTEDGAFSFFTVACIGCCSLAPVLVLDGETHGRLTPAKVRQLIKTVRRKDAELLKKNGEDR